MPKKYDFAADQDPEESEAPGAQSPKPKPDPDASEHILTCPKCGARFVEAEGMDDGEAATGDMSADEQ